MARFDPATGLLHLTWSSQPGLRYQVVFRDKIGAPWKLLASVAAVEAVTAVADDTFGRSERYYGLIVEVAN